MSLDEKWSWGKIKEESMVASRFLAGELFRAAALNACEYLSLLGGEITPTQNKKKSTTGRAIARSPWG